MFTYLKVLLKPSVKCRTQCQAFAGYAAVQHLAELGLTTMQRSWCNCVCGGSFQLFVAACGRAGADKAAPFACSKE